MKKPTFKRVHRIFETDNLATATVHEYRLNIFQPTRRPKMRDDIFATEWGKIRIKGKLGQTHADVLEALFFTAEKKRTYKGGKITFIVDPAQVRRVARQEQGAGMDNLCFDLIHTAVEIKEPERLACAGSLISFIDKSGKAGTRPNPKGAKKPFRNLWEITLGEVVKRLWEVDILMRHDPRPITVMRHGISQAVARLVISHKGQPNGGWYLDTLIAQVCGKLDKISLKHRRKELYQDAKNLSSVGIIVKKGRVKKRAVYTGKKDKIDKGEQYIQDEEQYIQEKISKEQHIQEVFSKI